MEATGRCVRTRAGRRGRGHGDAVDALAVPLRYSRDDRSLSSSRVHFKRMHLSSPPPPSRRPPPPPPFTGQVHPPFRPTAAGGPAPGRPTPAPTAPSPFCSTRRRPRPAPRHRECPPLLLPHPTTHWPAQSPLHGTTSFE
jgi:hypothetical protein